jgi:hypothetical protein
MSSFDMKHGWASILRDIKEGNKAEVADGLAAKIEQSAEGFANGTMTGISGQPFRERAELFVQNKNWRLTDTPITDAVVLRGYLKEGKFYDDILRLRVAEALAANVRDLKDELGDSSFRERSEKVVELIGSQARNMKQLAKKLNEGHEGQVVENNTRYMDPRDLGSTGPVIDNYETLR